MNCWSAGWLFHGGLGFVGQREVAAAACGYRSSLELATVINCFL